MIARGWRTEDPVSADGTVTGVNPGTTTVRAILDALSDTTDVTVVAAPYP